MLDRLTTRLYRRLGRNYRLLFLLLEEPAALAVATTATLLVASYYDPSTADVFWMLGAAWVSTLLGVTWALWQGLPYLERVRAWQESDAPTAEETFAAWDAATNFPMRSFRANSFCVALITGVPATAAFTAILELPATTALLLLLFATVPIAYGTILNYVIAEQLMRPVIVHIAESLPAEFAFEPNGLMLKKRLVLMLPVFTSFTGLIVGAILAGDDGTDALAKGVGVAVAVGVLLSIEMTVLLSRAVTAPIGRLRRGLAPILQADYSARVPVTTTDELGELTYEFNQMVEGLQERERMREAFGTYLDHDIVPLILSGNFPEDGVEVDVSIMFVDVRGFTSFAEQAEATEVVAALNALFATMVPIVREHGGHVDKFMGDGMLVVFGAPENWEDHADRAVRAGRAIVEAVNAPGCELRVGVGINTGRVVAGSIGGAGRLNFSVIGDAVNVAARVESATRETGDDLLMTRATRDALCTPVPCVSRGSLPLKGKADPVELLSLAPKAAYA